MYDGLCIGSFTRHFVFYVKFDIFLPTDSSIHQLQRGIKYGEFFAVS